ncbi:helix-turn-helix domain-containing protein [Algibacter miyuki]|uniref:helix-turn-helix domain-containing protein n=1 Tax=Algibacter miyuki TaxID=1306933 RepID=UPI003AFF657C
MVRTLLTELADYPEEYRRQINALSFIQRRTNLSRSRVMSILAELRKVVTLRSIAGCWKR